MILGRLKIDDKLEARRLLDQQVGGLGTFQAPTMVEAA